MTKIWSHAVTEEEYTEARFLSDAWFEYGLSVFDCAPALGRFPDIALEIIWDHPPADFFECGTLFVVSDRLKALLEEFGVAAEFFPLRVIHRGREYAERQFYFCNILDRVDCFDLKRGAYTFEETPGYAGMVRTVRKLAIDESKAAGHDLFRIANGGECIVCASDRVARRIGEEKLAGVRLVEPGEWPGC